MGRCPTRLRRRAGIRSTGRSTPGPLRHQLQRQLPRVARRVRAGQGRLPELGAGVRGRWRREHRQEQQNKGGRVHVRGVQRGVGTRAARGL